MPMPTWCASSYATSAASSATTRPNPPGSSTKAASATAWPNRGRPRRARNDGPGSSPAVRGPRGPAFDPEGRHQAGRSANDRLNWNNFTARLQSSHRCVFLFAQYTQPAACFSPSWHVHTQTVIAPDEAASGGSRRGAATLLGRNRQRRRGRRFAADPTGWGVRDCAAPSSRPESPSRLRGIAFHRGRCPGSNRCKPAAMRSRHRCIALGEENEPDDIRANARLRHGRRGAGFQWARGRG